MHTPPRGNFQFIHWLRSTYTSTLLYRKTVRVKSIPRHFRHTCGSGILLVYPWTWFFFIIIPFPKLKAKTWKLPRRRGCQVHLSKGHLYTRTRCITMRTIYVQINLKTVKQVTKDNIEPDNAFSSTISETEADVAFKMISFWSFTCKVFKVLYNRWPPL